MVDFRMRKDCRDFFRRVNEKGGFRFLFDSYYLCFLLGVTAGRRSNPTEGGIEAPAFVDSFPRPYDQQQRLLLGLMIVAEMRRDRVDVRDRVSVNVIVNALAGSGGLTSTGVQRMNEYSSGGYDVLRELYDGGEPWKLEDFMPRYLRILDDVIGRSDLTLPW